MRRFHLFEWEDFDWFPDVLRNGMTDYLQKAADLLDLASPIVPIIEKGLIKGKTRQIIDICSGGGGAIVGVNRKLQIEHGHKIKITLTDLYPNLSAFKRIANQSGGTINYHSESVNAMQVPETLTGLRTQFLSLHHFKPNDAKRILQNAADSNAPIAVFEATERKVVNLIGMLLLPIMVWLITPFIKPFTLSRFVFTYLIPLIPLCTMWDGMVSVLRSYTEAELLDMTQSLNADHYTWEVGKLPMKKGGGNIVYLLGYPT